MVVRVDGHQELAARQKRLGGSLNAPPCAGMTVLIMNMSWPLSLQTSSGKSGPILNWPVKPADLGFQLVQVSEGPGGKVFDLDPDSLEQKRQEIPVFFPARHGTGSHDQEGIRPARAITAVPTDTASDMPFSCSPSPKAPRMKLTANKVLSKHSLIAALDPGRKGLCQGRNIADLKVVHCRRVLPCGRPFPWGFRPY